MTHKIYLQAQFLFLGSILIFGLYTVEGALKTATVPYAVEGALRTATVQYTVGGALKTATVPYTVEGALRTATVQYTVWGALKTVPVKTSEDGLAAIHFSMCPLRAASSHMLVSNIKPCMSKTVVICLSVVCSHMLVCCQ